MTMTKSELIERVSIQQPDMTVKDVELAVKTILEVMSQSLARGKRIEIRGFGGFSLHYRKSRKGRNPKTGQEVALEAKFVPHFKPGKELRDRVNEQMQKEIAASADAQPCPSGTGQSEHAVPDRLNRTVISDNPKFSDYQSPYPM